MKNICSKTIKITKNSMISKRSYRNMDFETMKPEKLEKPVNLTVLNNIDIIQG